jgi:hypothetical protein
MIVTTMFSDDGRREAHVVREKDVLSVDMFERDKQERLKLIHTVDVTGHSEYYAEDTAENWVIYVIRN